MSKTIVSIVSEQTIPNYLFIKEMFLPGDSLLFISSSPEKFRERIGWIIKALDYHFPCETDSVIFPAGGEERWDDMKKRLLEKLSNEKQYFVNLTGGTKYMSLLVQHVFERYNSKFAYIPLPKNCILIPNQNESVTLKYRLSVGEYLSNYNITYSQKEVMEEASYTEAFFDKFIRGELDFKVIDLLRAYRNKKQINISEVETCEGTEKYPSIRGLAAFVDDIHFPAMSKGILNKAEICYLTGGWFEEYMYHKIEEYIHPQDICLGVLIQGTEKHNQNDLDVVFTSGNKLFVIECKTGIVGERMFNETVYKATAIKEAVLGLSAKTFIVSLAVNDEKLKRTAKNMGIDYKSREDVLDLDAFMKEIRNAAKD